MVLGLFVSLILGVFIGRVSMKRPETPKSDVGVQWTEPILIQNSKSFRASLANFWGPDS
jgi:hypothetical protein